MQNNELCAHAIMAHGADVWYTNEDGLNALMLAAKKDLANVLKSCGRKLHLPRSTKKIKTVEVPCFSPYITVMKNQ